MTPADKMEAVREMYVKGELTADDVRSVLEPKPKPRKSDERCRECGQELNDATGAMNAHLFFEALLKSTQVPHYGEKQKDWINQLLKRATEAGLYHPEKP